MKAAGLNPVLSAGGSGASTPQGAEGDYGDNARLFDLLSQQLSNSAKTTSKVVDTLSKTLQQFSDPWSKFSAKGRFLSKEYAPSESDSGVADVVDALSALDSINSASQQSSGRYSYLTPDYKGYTEYQLTRGQENLLLNALRLFGLGSAVGAGGRLFGLSGVGSVASASALRKLNPDRVFILPDYEHANFYS